MKKVTMIGFPLKLIISIMAHNNTFGDTTPSVSREKHSTGIGARISTIRTSIKTRFLSLFNPSRKPPIPWRDPSIHTEDITWRD